jgi:hypothetical protein
MATPDLCVGGQCMTGKATPPYHNLSISENQQQTCTIGTCGTYSPCCDRHGGELHQDTSHDVRAKWPIFSREPVFQQDFR